MSSLTDDDTIGTAKHELRQNWRAGLNCACCGNRVQLYPRPIYSTMCRDLIALYRLGPGWHHNREFKDDVSAGDFHKFRYWRIIEQKPNDDDGKRDSGMWRITELGRDFVEERVSVPKTAYVYNRKVREWSDDSIKIREALGKKFSYPELMGFLI